MKENDFDIQVRNLLQNATETVSPGVWSGVQAGLARRARVVTIRRWSYAAVAAAAVLAGALVLLRPSVPSANPALMLANLDFNTSQPCTLIEELPTTKVYSIPTRNSVVPVAVQTPVEQPVITEEKEEAEEVAAVPAVPQEKGQAPSAQKNGFDQDSRILDALAASETARSRRRQNAFSFTVSGNVQGNQRGEVAIAPGSRTHGLPEAFTNKEGIYNESPEVSFRLPFSAGIGINYNFTPRWGIGTGVRYTNLGRTFVGDYVSNQGFTLENRDIDNQQHWLGVPLNVYFSIVNTSRWNVHVFTGGSVEFLVDNDYLIHNSPKDVHFHQRGTAAPQWSAGVGAGIEFKINPFFGIYLDPAVRYYFGTELQPRSLRTIQPLRFDIEAGLRFSVGK